MANLGDAIKGLLTGAGEEYLGHLREKRSRQAKEAEATRKRARELIDQANKRAYETAESQTDVLTGLYKYADQLTPDALKALEQSIEGRGTGVEIDPLTGRVQPKPFDMPELSFQPSAKDQSLIDYWGQQKETSAATEALREQQKLESEARTTREDKRVAAYVKSLQDKTKKQSTENKIRDLKLQSDLLNNQEKTILAGLRKKKERRVNPRTGRTERILVPDEDSAGPQTKGTLQNIRSQREAVGLILRDLNAKALREKGIYTAEQKQKAAIYLEQNGQVVHPKNIEAVLKFKFDEVMNYIPR